MRGPDLGNSVCPRGLGLGIVEIRPAMELVTGLISINIIVIDRCIGKTTKHSQT
jgi:hypothetical protein